MSRGPRIGVFGGTFDPIHNGHLAVARTVTERFGLEKLVFVPAWTPPHKRGQKITHACHRFAMAALALEGRPDWVLSTVEAEAPEFPYTVDTIVRLGERYPEGVPFFFLMGADSFEDLPGWRDYLRLVESCNIIVTARPGHDLGTHHLPDSARRRIVDLRGTAPGGGVEDGAETRIYLTDDAFFDLSSTGVREAVQAGEPIDSIVPKAVGAYITKQRFYRRENE